MSVNTTEKINNPSPGLFGSYFTPTKTPPTIKQEAQKVTLLGAALIFSIYALRQLENEGPLNDVLFVPIIEEILYRGACTKIIDVSLNVIQGRPKTSAQEQARKTARAVIVAAIFGITHDHSPIIKFWLLGRALGYLKEETGGYILPIALHMIHNASSHFEQELIGSNRFPFPIGTTIDILTLWVLGKNINPWKGIKETYNYFNRRSPKNF